MLKTTVSSVAFKSWITALNSVLDEATLHVAKDGIRLRAMDSSQIALIDTHIKPECFNEYSFQSESEKEAITIDIDGLFKILKRSKPEDHISFNLVDGKMQLTLDGKTKRDYKLNQLSAVDREQKYPQIQFTAKSVVIAKTLRELLKDASTIGSTCCRLSIGKQMSLVSDGLSGSLSVEEIGEESEAKESASSLYNIEFLEKILTSADKAVTIELKKDSPLRMQYELHGVQVTYFLAPRIDS